MHEIMYESFDFNCDKRKVEAEINFEVSNRTYQEGGHGLPRPINWTNKIFNSREEAENYIENLRGDYIQIAVIYNEYCGINKMLEENEKYKKIDNNKTMLYNEYRKLIETNHFKDVKTKYITCPKCGSKINSEIYNKGGCYVQTNYCPICRKGMFSKRVDNKIVSLQNKIDKEDEKIQALKKQLEKKIKPVKKWLVKYEYHV